MAATNDDLLRVLQDIDKKLFVMINGADPDEALAQIAAFKLKEKNKVS